MLISPELLCQISSNFHRFGRIWVLQVDKVECQSELENPLILACEYYQKIHTFVPIVAWLSFWFYWFGRNFVWVYFLLCLPCGLARPLIYIYIHIYGPRKYASNYGQKEECVQVILRQAAQGGSFRQLKMFLFSIRIFYH